MPLGRAVRERDRPVRAAGPGPLRRQRDNAALGELLEEARGQAHAAGARAGLPVQVLADGQGEFGAAQPGASLHHFLHVGDLPACEALAEERRGREVLNARVNRWACCHPSTESQNAASMSTPWTKKLSPWVQIPLNQPLRNSDKTVNGKEYCRQQNECHWRPGASLRRIVALATAPPSAAVYCSASKDTVMSGGLRKFAT